MDVAAKLRNSLLQKEGAALEIQRALTAIPAIGPENGGQGEAEKARLVEHMLAGMGLENIMRLNAPDPRTASGYRPNLICRLAGETDRTLWLFGHLDVVPPGDPAMWEGNPWQIRHEGDLLYGRGVEDNQQAVTSMLLLADALTTLHIKPKLSLGLVFMSDEECGSKYGLDHILKTSAAIFKKDDFYIIPDGGAPDAGVVEVAEKSQLWLKFEIIGRQCHASMPAEGKNAFVAASALVCALTGLSALFPELDPLFMPPSSTFTPTRHDANTPGINILPGRDVFYMDCRLLPQCGKDDVLKEAGRIAQKIAAEYDVDINIEIVHCQASTFTSPQTPVMTPLLKAIASIYGIEARPKGIGGATVAAFLRQMDLPAVVWSCIRNTCHMPNECSSLSATCRDAAVFGEIIMDGADYGR